MFRHFLLCLMILSPLLTFLAAASDRLRVPDFVKCNRNSVTSFTGDVTSYSRKPMSLTLTIATDAGTRETFVIEYSEPKKLVKKMYRAGIALTLNDLLAMESKFLLSEDVSHATVWQCANPEHGILINWTDPPSYSGLSAKGVNIKVDSATSLQT